MNDGMVSAIKAIRTLGGYRHDGAKLHREDCERIVAGVAEALDMSFDDVAGRLSRWFGEHDVRLETEARNRLRDELGT